MSLQNQSIKEEVELVEKCQKGDHDAFKKLYDSFKIKVYSIVYYMLGDEGDALEVTQLVFIKIYRSIHSFRFEANVNTWIYKLSTNICLNYMKKEKRKRSVSLDAIQDLPGVAVQEPDVDFHKKLETSEAVQKVIMKLRPKLRSVVILKYINDLSYSEISEVLGCSIGTVSSRLNRSHKILYNELKFLVE